MLHNIYAFLFLLFTMLASAAPVGDETVTVTDHAVRYGTGGGIAGLIILILDIIVIVEVLQSNRPVPHKLLWILIVVLFPLVGMLIYFFFSNREAHKSSYEPIL
ncbi:hypothetical protein PV08_08223 [Exophiala spinifera]|uniref:Cardiolipin synthase N-terminal domain-containing protein n=1 Tax=Exophiala spinifera TaxID=91928 RepID=A0A0D1YDI6_9EURO|nr:uncharacterized protein PV08_08223 [Exophiala spinifera]KIW13036.1 hypothetical protein PV08_08223 [Exophiala spinifera]